MTLLIALLLMNHIGGFETFEYFGVFGLWLLHCVVTR